VATRLENNGLVHESLRRKSLDGRSRTILLEASLSEGDHLLGAIMAHHSRSS